MIEIIPAIDIIDGRCVRLTKGDFADKKVYDASPLEMAMQYADCGVRRIHMVDLDGARRSKPMNMKTLEEVASKSGVEIEWGGGIADDSALASVFNAGATQAIVGSVAALRPAEFSRWLKIFGPDRILLGADVRDGVVAVKGWVQQTGLTLYEQISWFLEDGLKFVVCTDISRDGLLKGPSFDLYAELMEEFQSVIFTASGGISGMDDIKELDRIGVPKVVVGKAIYEKRIKLDDIRAWSLNA
ncbi:MAG: 1-(5-phosphoribosyl)-5-[(5-phosphoribosylamino)methylideneamino]imidazole-4-carboxamide isomerase [Bacteroidales bacterium]|nr:1-(5-phosphoribosyl)-5-[(5-phosphoribosylamino)methylideneamino]imidazole-4-carboxamide isomerase [Bacteroidales bacterium]